MINSVSWEDIRDQMHQGKLILANHRLNACRFNLDNLGLPCTVCGHIMHMNTDNLVLDACVHRYQRFVELHGAVQPSRTINLVGGDLEESQW